MRRFLLLLGIVASTAFAGGPLPFGRDLPPPKRGLVRAKGAGAVFDCLAPASRSLWQTEQQTAGAAASASLLREDGDQTVLTLRATAQPSARMALPEAGADAARTITYFAFECRSSQPARLAIRLAGSGRHVNEAHFETATGSEWRQVFLPLTDSPFKTLGSIAAVEFKLQSDATGAAVELRQIALGATPFTDRSWQGQVGTISLEGDWRFAADPADEGTAHTWARPDFDDTSWRTLKVGIPWERQQVEHHGWGWYRQQIFIPAAWTGVPLTLELGEIPSDDDVWFNGERVGGLHGEYKYKNWIDRRYVVLPKQIRYGALNTIAVRVWGGDLTFIGHSSGLAKSPHLARLDPFPVGLRSPSGDTVPAERFDLSDAQRGIPLELVLSFPSELAAAKGATCHYRLCDPLQAVLAAGQAPLRDTGSVTAEAVAPLSSAEAQTLYLRGRGSIDLVVTDEHNQPIYAGRRHLDRLSFSNRDLTPLNPLPPTLEETPYGRLRLVDTIDCATPVAEEEHPYLQGGFESALQRMTPGSDPGVQVREILGRRARESGFGWFAYRIGRGRLKPHSTYLLRIEYPEDQPRFCPIEIQTGQNYQDVGWKNGVGPDDVYDNWPLSQQWQWYDVIVPLDDETVGTGGTGSAPAENGVWVYFMNKLKPHSYYSMYSGGPAIATIKLYEIDPAQNAPAIRRPAGLPQRVLAFDWERQPDHDPYDLVRYARLMGYSAISPVILKWAFANYSAPLSGYTTITIDSQNYWAKEAPVSSASANAQPEDRSSVHARYLAATRQLGIDYIPRIEWGGSMDLPKSARALDVNGQPMKPNRFEQWCGNLLQPETWDDLQRLMDHLIAPYTASNPQLKGVLWRIRCSRMPISYGQADLERFARETGAKLPPGLAAQWAAWAAGEGRKDYEDWWHRKRAEFHLRLERLLQSYRPDLRLYYFNWDPDKFGLIDPDLSAWAFLSLVDTPGPEGGRAAYEKEREVRRSFTDEDYRSVLHTGNFGRAFNGLNRADLGLRPELYAAATGIELFAPVNYRCYADRPGYLNYFRTAEGLAVSHAVTYDEVASRTINPKYEGNMIVPAGAPFSMALELLAYFHGDARTLSYTAYTFGRGFAAAHRRFAQAYLALPAISGTIVEQSDSDVKIRTYASPQGTYVGVAYKGDAARKVSVRIPRSAGSKVTDLVTQRVVPAQVDGDRLRFEVPTGPMELNAFLVQ